MRKLVSFRDSMIIGVKLYLINDWEALVIERHDDMSIGRIFRVAQDDWGDSGGKSEGDLGTREGVERVEKIARAEADLGICGRGELSGDFGVIFAIFVCDRVGGKDIWFSYFADDGAVSGAREEGGKFSDTNEFFAIDNGGNITFFWDEFMIIGVGGID